MRRSFLILILLFLSQTIIARNLGNTASEPIVNFTQDKAYSCENSATIAFTNESAFAASYLWDFGDGSSSTEENPLHTYSQTGIYDVKLIAYGNSSCACMDSLVKTNLISITNDGPLVPATCEPVTTYADYLHGVRFVSFGGIRNYSGPDTEGYSDFTCSTLGQVKQGSFYTLEVRSFATENRVQVWIDYNNDGDFSAGERVYNVYGQTKNHSAQIYIPEGSVVNTPLRFRVKSGDNYDDPCMEIQLGQAEDYRLIISENDLVPEAAFTSSNRFLNPSETVDFSDNSIHYPESWQWVFEGGSPATSTLQNPSVQYSDFGSYDVSLIVSNAFGSDTLVMPDFVKVVHKVNMCTQETVTYAQGQLFDSGGPDNPYSNNENCAILIAPECAQSITFSFKAIGIMYYWDYLKIYNGSDASAPLLLNTSDGKNVYEATAHSGEMYITFESNSNTTSSGWSAIWESDVAGAMPEAEFEVSDTNPELNATVVFNDLSIEFPVSREWDFGDGGTSDLQNPTHIFSQPGTYSVDLIVTNCFGSDAVSREIHVQEAAELSISPQDTLDIVVNCSSQTMGNFTIYNSGTGDLEVNPLETIGASGGTVRMLIFSYEADGQVLSNTIAALDEYDTGVVYSVSTASSAAQLTADLQNTDILLITGSLNYGFYVFQQVSDAFVEFVDGGGKIIFCGNPGLIYSQLFESYSSEDDNTDILNINPSHPLMEGIGSGFEGESSMLFYGLNGNEELTEIAVSATDGDELAVFEKNIGQGKVVYLAFTYSEPNIVSKRILANTVNYFADEIRPAWMNIPDLAQNNTVPPGDSLVVQVDFDASDLLAGDYYHTVQFNTNKPGSDTISYTFHLEVSGGASLSASADALALDPVLAGHSSYDTLVVINAGCDSLLLQPSVSTNMFSVEPVSLYVPAFSQDTLYISFSGNVVGDYSDELALVSNAGNQIIPLSGSVVEPPVLEISPSDTLTAVANCGTTSTQTITITNSGESDLEIDLKNLAGGVPKVLVLTTHAFLEDRVPNMLAAIDQHFTNYGMSTSNAANSAELETDLEDIDILIIPRQGFYSDSFFSSLSDALTGFAESGGQILFCANTFVPATGIFGSAYSNMVSVNGLLENIAPNHPIMQNFQTEPFLNPENTISYRWGENPDVYPLCRVIFDMNDYAAAYTNYGSKSMVYLGFDYSVVTPQNSQIIGNTMAFFAEKAIPNWLDSISLQSTATIAAGESLDVSVTFTGENLQSGDYYLDGFITTNDPANDTLIYVLHFDVSAAAILDLSANSVNFDPILAGLTATDTIYVNNPGCDTLTVAGNISDPNFSFLPDSLSIPPFSQDTLFVFFHPGDAGMFSGQLALSTNGNDEVISLSGEGLAAPAISITPDTVYVDVTDCADSVSVGFEIQNQGNGILDYNVSVDDWKPTLAEVLYNLNENHSDLTSPISNLFYFEGGDTGTFISGTDVAMYVEGNRLRPDSYYDHLAPYTNSEIVTNNFFGNGSSYFTSKVDGLFVLAADLNSLDKFSINGNLGSYPSGTTQGFEYAYVNAAGISYTCFATRTTGGGIYQHSVNHLIIMRSDTGLSQSYASGNEHENHQINGLSHIDRMYYLLFSTDVGTVASAAEMEEMFNTFVDSFIGAAVNGTNISGEVNPGESVDVSVTLSTAGLQAGTHEIPILIVSNDPEQPSDTVWAVLNIPENSCAEFTHYSEMDCSGHQYFRDQSVTNPVSWSWGFGDGEVSTEQNPLHAYAQNGTYEVSLEACNSVDCNTISQMIEVDSAGGLDLICTPTTAADHSDYYISKITLGSSTRNSIGNASGYQDFTCNAPFLVTAGDYYTFNMFFSDNTDFHVRAWLDFNNDNVFDESELLYSYHSVFYVASSSLTVPIDAVLGEPLRLRIMADTLFHEACDSLAVGAVEDYAVIISAAFEPPVADFSSHTADPCTGEYTFTDHSTHSPNAWLWDFGDGITSTEQNPEHTFTTSGEHTVLLTATNTIGSDSYSETYNLDPFGFSELTASADPIINEPVEFNAPGDGITFWHWDFGDGVTIISSTATVTHLYSQPGLYIVTVNSGNHICTYELALTIEVSDPVGVPTILNNSGIRIFPNPSTGKIFIEMSEDMEVENVNLYNALGQRIDIEMHLIHSNRIRVEVNRAAAGVYILVLHTRDGRDLRRKVIFE